MNPRDCRAVVLDARYLAASAAAGLVGLVAFGLVSAIIPNPVFGRQIPPEPFAIAVWVASGLLMGLLAGTYLVPPPAVAASIGRPGVVAIAESSPADPGGDPAGRGPASGDLASVADPEAERRSSVLGYASGLAAFLAIGCPVCNKVALVLLGASGALSIWAPLQPIIGLASVALLAAALAWRLRMRARGNACSLA